MSNTRHSESSKVIRVSALIPTGSHMPANTKLQNDLDYILNQARGTTLLDELAMIRAAIRRYAETGNAEDSVAWAAEQISNSVSNYRP
jgi:hypothetical protein